MSVEEKRVGGCARAVLPLGLLGPGERAEILSIRDSPDRACACRMQELGLCVGRVVEMLANGGGGPLLLKVDESRIAVDRGVAMRILAGEAL